MKKKKEERKKERKGVSHFLLLAFFSLPFQCILSSASNFQLFSPFVFQKITLQTHFCPSMVDLCWPSSSLPGNKLLGSSKANEDNSTFFTGVFVSIDRERDGSAGVR
jgi:hypothetical protein